MNDPITKRQKEILDYVTESISDNGYAPSYREIGKNFKLSSVATVAEHINTLRTKGYLDVDPGCARSLQVCETNNTKDAAIMPLIGFIAAGFPIQAIKTPESLDIPHDMSGPNTYALKVQGDSMVDDGILDGDYVVIEECKQPQNGDIVVALLDNENVTLKRYYKEADHIRLQPANQKYTAIRTRYVDVQGKVRGVIRKFH